MRSFLVLVFLFLLSSAFGRSLLNEKSRRVRRKVGLFPGTKWCGAGNTALSEDDLAEGSGKAADTCCREHDHCPITVLPYKYQHGIFNLRPWPISHCSCDTKFFDCLTTNKDTVSDSVGQMYFNVLRLPCFDDDTNLKMRKYIIQTDSSLNKL